MLKKLKIMVFIVFLSTFLLPKFNLADDILETFETLDTANIIDTSSKNLTDADANYPSINSKSAVVIERSTNTILFGKNEDEQRKMASTTKIMTAIIVIENADLSKTISVSPNAAKTTGSRLGLTANATITVNDLLYGLMLCSGNDAAVALAEHVANTVQEFADLMNKKAKELGLENTNFVTPHGLDEDNHYTTAYELALLTNYALQNEIFAKIVSTSSYTVTINDYKKNLNNTNELLNLVDGIYGVKTGFTNGANRCLVSSCKRDELDIICVVLGADTKKDRTSDSIKLIEYAFNNFEMINLEDIITTKFNDWSSSHPNFEINKGISNNIIPKLQDIPYKFFPMNKTNISSIQIYIDCIYNFEAPIIKETVIGTLTCYIDNNTTFTFNIYNAETINKKTIYDYFKALNNNFIFYLENSFLFS